MKLNRICIWNFTNTIKDLKKPKLWTFEVFRSLKNLKNLGFSKPFSSPGRWLCYSVNVSAARERFLHWVGSSGLARQRRRSIFFWGYGGWTTEGQRPEWGAEDGSEVSVPSQCGEGDHGCQEPCNFFKEIYMQISILLPFGVVLGDGRKYNYSLPSIFIEGCGESPSPPGSTPL